MVDDADETCFGFLLWQRGQGNFELITHKVLSEQKAEARFWVVNWGRVEWLRGRFWEKDAGRITVVGSDPSRAFLGRL